MKRIEKLRQKSGFTMAEILVAVAILSIVTLTGAISFAQMTKNNRQTTADKAAESIAFTVQNRLSEIYSFDYGKREVFFLDNAETHVQPALSDNGSGDDGLIRLGECRKGGHLLDDGTESALNGLLDGGKAIASEFYQNGIIIEFDPVVCQVYSVTYISDMNKVELLNQVYNPDHMTTGEGGENIRNSVSYRKSKFDGYVGYYQMDVGTLLDEQKCEYQLEVCNQEMFYVRFRVPVDEDEGKITLDVYVGDAAESHYKTFTLRNESMYNVYDEKNVTRVSAVGGTAYDYYILLDDITTKGMRFTDLFADEIQEHSDSFFPGADITRVVPKRDGTEIESMGTDGKWNTLYADGSFDEDEETKETALIENFRHLENLDKSISGRFESGDAHAAAKNILPLKCAKQKNNLIWKRGEEDEVDGFVEKIAAMKQEIYGTHTEETELAVYSGDANDSTVYNKAKKCSYQPIDFSVKSGERFVYDAEGEEHTSYCIKNLLVKAPEYTEYDEIEPVKKDAPGTIEKNPEQYHVDAGMFGFVNVECANDTVFEVKNLIFDHADVEGGANSGSLIGRINVVHLLSSTDGAAFSSQERGLVKLKNVISQGDLYIYGKMPYDEETKKIYARSHAGGMIGNANEVDMDMEECHVRGKNAFIYTDMNGSIPVEGSDRLAGRSAIGGGAAGGMVASIQWSKYSIRKCSTTAYVYGEKADGVGGFIGRSDGNFGKSEIIGCYVGAHTENGQYQRGIFRKNHPDMVGSNVAGFYATGGFMGSCILVKSELTIKNSFSAASVYNTNLIKKNDVHVGGFFGGVMQGSGGKAHIQECYAIGRIYIDTEYTYGKVGTFIGVIKNNGLNRYLYGNSNYVLKDVNFLIYRMVGDKSNADLGSFVSAAWDASEAAGEDETVLTAPEAATRRAYDEEGEETERDIYPYPVYEDMVYYGDFEKPSALEQFDIDWSVVNKDVLSVKFLIPKDKIGDRCFVSLMIQGKKSGKKYYAPFAIGWFKDGSSGKKSVKGEFVDPEEMMDGFILGDNKYKLDSSKLPIAYGEAKESVYEVPVILDDITEKKGNFAYRFPELAAGEDVEIYVKAGIHNMLSEDFNLNDATGQTGDDDIDVSRTATLHDGALGKLEVNSLFAKGSNGGSSAPAGGRTAVVRYGRHLQNLDPVVSGINGSGKEGGTGNGLTFTSAKQTKNIDWKDFFCPDEGEKKSIYSFYLERRSTPVADGGEYYGIFNQKLKKYQGDMGEKAAQIANIVTSGRAEISFENFADGDDSGSDRKTYYDKGYAAGLFRWIESEEMTISDLKLSGFTVRGYETSDGSVGSLVGRVQQKKEQNDTPQRKPPKIKLTGIELAGNDVLAEKYQYAGGLAGYAGDKVEITVEDTKVSGSESIVSNEKASGGFVGYVGGEGTLTLKNITISGEMSVKGQLSAGGIVSSVGTKGEFIVTEFKQTGTLSVEAQTNDAGGFAGTLAVKTLKISDCTIGDDKDCNVVSKGGKAGGLAGSIGLYGSGTIKGITLKNFNVTGKGSTGGVFGDLSKADSGSGYECSIYNVHTYGKKAYVYGKKTDDPRTEGTGGFAGSVGEKNVFTLAINSCSASVYVASENRFTGGFIGSIALNMNGTITNSYSGGHTTASGHYAGEAAIQEDADGEISLVKSGGYNVYGMADYTGSEIVTGGFIGRNYGEEITVKKCFSTASVATVGHNKVQVKTAGFCGGNWVPSDKRGTIQSCYSAGKVFLPVNGTYYKSFTDVFCCDSCKEGELKNAYLASMAGDDITNGKSRAVLKTYEQLSLMGDAPAPDETICFNCPDEDYPFPFYVDEGADKNYYGDFLTDD